MLSNFIYIGVILAFSIGKPFRRPFYTNIWFSVNIIILEIYAVLMALFPSTRLPWFDFSDTLNEEWLERVVLFGHITILVIYTY